MDDHLKKGVQMVHKLGISFNVWMTKESQTNKPFEMTALNRNERLKILKNLPQYFDKIFIAIFAEQWSR